MADTLLHITIAHEIATHPGLAAPVAQLIQRYPDAWAMGSVLVDLPYYDTLLRSGLQTLRSRPAVYHPFGQTLHHSQCRRLCIELVKAAATDEMRVLAYGALTHFAVDIVFHAEIERRIQHTDISHDTLERQIGILCHQYLLGHSGVGTPYTITSTFLFPDPDWPTFVNNVLSGIYNGAPGVSVLRKWQRSLRAFGLLYSQPWFPWLSTRAPDDSMLRRTATALCAQAIENAIEYVNAAFNYRSGNLHIDAFRQCLPLRRMTDGEPE